jgi:uncharacterized protein (TIGR03437 family)
VKRFSAVKSVVMLALLGGSFLHAQSGQFTNGNFETGDFSGWTQGGGYWNGEWPIDPSKYLPGGSNFNLGYKVNNVLGPGPLTDPRTDNKLQYVYSGSKTAKVNDENNNNSISVISQTVSNYTDAHIYFAWAAVLQSSHGPTDSDNFVLQLKDVTTGENIYQVAYNSANAANAGLFTQSTQGWFYTSWQVQDLDVSERRGHTFTLTLLASDCPYGGHAGYVYLDGFGAVTPPTGTGPAGGLLTVNGSQDLGTFPLGNSINGGLSASGGTPPYSWEASGLPTGVSSSSGSISGIPTQPGSYSVSLQVTDAAGTTAAGSLTFSVFGFTSTSLPPGIVFSPYLNSVGTAGGKPPYTFTFSGLPAGINGNGSGTMQGIVTAAGTSSVLVVAVDSSGASVSARLPMIFSIAAPLGVSCSLPGGMVRQVYSQVLSGASGGAPPYSWIISSGKLPDGLTLRSGGTIAGTPSKSGTFGFGARVTDVTGASAVGSCALSISPAPLSIMIPTMPNGMAPVEFPPQVITASGGVPPYRFAISGGALPNGMSLSSDGMITGTPGSQGNFSFTVTATDSAPPVPASLEGASSLQSDAFLPRASGNSTISFTVRPFSVDLILAAGSVDFALSAGSTLPVSQLVAVQSSSTATLIPYSVSVPPDANWLSVTPTAGTTPGLLSVRPNDNALLLAASATTYQTTVTVNCLNPAPCAGNSQTFAVNLKVSVNAPQLDLLSDLVSFSAAPGTGRMTQSLGLQNSGGGTIGVGSITCDAPWCGVAGVPGSIAGGLTSNIAVSADPTGLARGYYRGVLTIRASTGVSAVPVTLFVSSSSSISLQPSGVQFQSLAGGVPNGPFTSFLVNVSGTSAVNWSASVLPGASWLSLTGAGGSASPSQPGAVNFTINPGIAAGLTSKTYYGTIRVSIDGFSNTPQDFEVVLNVGPSNGTQRPYPSPGGLLFITQGAAIPAPQAVTVSTNSIFAVDTQLSTSTADGGNWLSATPLMGQAQPTRSLATQVSVDPSKLTPGIYTGGVNYAFSSLAVRTVNVTLIVKALPKPAINSGFGPLADPPTCTPTRLATVQTALVSNFSQPTAWPTPLQMLLINDCGNAVPNGQIVATFSNGDPPLALRVADAGIGLYSTTWVPRGSSQQTTITLRASATGFTPVTTQIGGAVTANAAPLLARNSTQHVYNPLAGGGLAPGTLVQISGTALAGGSASATGSPLPTTLSGTQVFIGGIAAPISSVSPTQLNVVIPNGLTPFSQYQVVVNANGALTTPDSIQLTSTSPGAATATGGIVLATHADGSAVTQAAPATPGEALILTAAGLGLTDVPVVDGAAAPASPLANALAAVTVTVDGAPAKVSFAGLKAGAVAVYQVNFTVPDASKNGDLSLVVAQEGQPGNATVLPVKKK